MKNSMGRVMIIGVLALSGCSVHFHGEAGSSGSSATSGDEKPHKKHKVVHDKSKKPGAEASANDKPSHGGGSQVNVHTGIHGAAGSGSARPATNAGAGGSGAGGSTIAGAGSATQPNAGAQSGGTAGASGGSASGSSAANAHAGVHGAAGSGSVSGANTTANPAAHAGSGSPVTALPSGNQSAGAMNPAAHGGGSAAAALGADHHPANHGQGSLAAAVAQASQGISGAVTGNANAGGGAGAGNADANSTGPSGGRGMLPGPSVAGLATSIGRRKPSDIDKRRTKLADEEKIAARPETKVEDKPSDTDKANAKPEISGNNGAYAVLPGKGNRFTGGRINKPVRIEGLSCKLKSPKAKKGGKVALEGEGFDENAAISLGGSELKVRSLSGTRIVAQLPKDLEVGGNVTLKQGAFVAPCGTLEIEGQ